MATTQNVAFPTDPRFIDMTGRTYGHLTVVAYESHRNGKAFWKVRCECGVVKAVNGSNLRRGVVRSCGCIKLQQSVLGTRFCRWTVVKEIGRDRTGNRKVLCRCSCKRGTERAVSVTALLGGRSRSCGCICTESRTKHGQSGTSEFRIWKHMIERCSNRNSVNYKNYGGRGISVCDRWRSSFVAFIDDMGARPSSTHTIERIDNNGNYEPGNCRWATPKEQSRNKRNNRFVTEDGKTMCVSQWAETIGVSSGCIAKRVRNGVSVYGKR